MPFSFGLFSSSLLIFFVHALVFSAGATVTGINRDIRSGRWLGLLLLLLALYVSPFMLGYAGWYGLDGYREVLFYLPLQQVLLIGPVMRFYLRSLLYPGVSFGRKDWLHLVPGGLYLLYSLVIAVADAVLYPEPGFYADGKDKDFDDWYQVAGFVSLMGYFGASLHLYQQYQKQIFEQLSYAEEVTYTWVRRFLVVFLVIIVLRALFFVLNPEWDEFGRKYWYYLALSVVGYGLAIQGYRQNVLLAAARHTRPLPPAPEILPPPDLPPAEEGPAFDAAAWMHQIDRAMEEGLFYQNPVLSLSDLAAHLGTTTRNVSQAINKGTGLNFNDYVNRFRVQAVIREFNQGTHKQHTLLGIALGCGFNSKSTFNRAFKKYAGLSPAEFLRQAPESGIKS